jgi:membrane-bound serine protease (ClpP class)
MLVMGQLARTRTAPLRTGPEQYVGQVATVYQPLMPQGRVWFEGQLWNANVRSGQTVPIHQPVRIVGVKGLTLIVEPETKAGQPGAAPTRT